MADILSWRLGNRIDLPNRHFMVHLNYAIRQMGRPSLIPTDQHLTTSHQEDEEEESLPRCYNLNTQKLPPQT